MEINLTDAQLKQELEKWFKKYADDKNVWNRTKTGEFLKAKLDSLNHWKAAPRGNPSKGFRNMVQRMNYDD